MYQLLICDDNLHQANFVEQLLLQQNAPSIFHIDKITNPFLFIQKLQQHDWIYDIILLDIELGEFNGIEIAREINKINAETQIIYITNYQNYATSVYESDHVFFIIKKELEKWLLQALAKAISNLNQIRSEILVIHTSHKEQILPQNCILYLERKLRETIIVTTSKNYTTPEKLISLQSQLKESFIQCHRSYIVNLHHVASYCTSSFIMDNEDNISISRSYHSSTHKAFFAFLAFHKTTLD